MKLVGRAKVLSVEEYQRKDGSKGYRCVALTDDNNPVVFYRPAEEEPKAESVYNMMLGYDSNLKPVIRYQVAK